MGALNSLIKVGGKALSKTGKEVAKNAAEEATEKLTKKVAEKATQKAISDTARNVANKTVRELATEGSISSTAKMSELVKGASLSGAGKSTLAKNAGSTLDGLLGKSSGLTLKNAKLPKATKLADEFAGTDLAKTAKQDLAEAASRNNKLVTDLASDPDNMWFSKRELTDTKIGDLYPGNAKNRFGSNPDTIIPAEKSDIAKMIKDGKLKVDDNSRGSKTIKRYELTGKPLSYDEKNSLVNAIKDNLPENEAMGINLEPEDFVNENQLRLIDQTSEPTTRSIPVDKVNTRKKNVKVSRPVADAGVDTAVSETPATTNPTFTNEVAELKAQLGTAGGAGRGNGGNLTNTTTAQPDYEEFGNNKANVKLKNGDTTNIKVGPSATGSSSQQRAVRKLDDMTAKSMNASAKQYRGLVDKSGSIDGYYKTVAERMRAEKIDQANVAQKAQSALSLREDIKQQGLAYAEANGVTINLAGIDNTIGLSATQKRKLAELGLGLDEMLGGTGIVSPTQAEEIYKTLRDYAYNWSDSKDALTKVAGNACEKEANAVRDLIDKTMDNINVDYKTSLLEEAANNGEDPAYLRQLAGKKGFKFSDLRKDQSDWITMNDLAGNKIKDDPTLNVFGVDTGVPNPLRGTAEKLKEKYYQRQAGGGSNVPPTGNTGATASGAENNINFETVPAGQSKLGQLLGKGKTAGLVGAGVLGGMMLGGGGAQGQGNTGVADSATGTGLGATAGTTGLGATETAVADPYATLTVGGYTYDELEQGYTNALMAGDTDAAKLILQMIDMWESKASRYEDTLDSSSSSSSTSNGSLGSKQQAAINVLSALMNNYQAQGPVGGRFTQFMNMLTGGGYNPEVSAYDSGSRGSLSTVIKALGDTGALSDSDQQRAQGLIPQTTDSEASAKAKYQQLIQILQGAGTQ